MDFTIADRAGTWLVNTGAFRMPDPSTGIIYEPGTPTKGTHSDWVKGQPTIEECGDPTKADPAPEPEAKAPKK